MAALKVTWIGEWTQDQSRKLTEDLLQFFYDQHPRQRVREPDTSACSESPISRAE